MQSPSADLQRISSAAPKFKGKSRCARSILCKRVPDQRGIQQGSTLQVDLAHIRSLQ
jgi:hypothetical protein